MDLPSAELPARTLVVAIDPGKVTHRVLLADGERGLIEDPVSLPTLREGIERLCELMAPRLEAARAAGLVRADLTPDDAVIVLAMVDGAVAPLRDRGERERASARAFEIALDGLRVGA